MNHEIIEAYSGDSCGLPRPAPKPSRVGCRVRLAPVRKRPFVRRADAALLTAVFPSQNPSETCSRVGDYQSAQLLEVGGRPQPPGAVTGFPGSVRSRALGKAGPGVPVGPLRITSTVLWHLVMIETSSL